MMVTWVRGSFKNVHGSLDFDPKNPRALAVEAIIDAARRSSEEVSSSGRAARWVSSLIAGAPKK